MTESNHFVFRYIIILLWIAMTSFFYFVGHSRFGLFVLTLFVILTWAYSEYFHTVIITPIIIRTSRLEGEINILEKFESKVKKRK